MNFGEYLACLGVAALLSNQPKPYTMGWAPHRFLLRGVGGTEIRDALTLLISGTARVDERATQAAKHDDAYPALHLVMADGSAMPLNHWLSPDFSGKSDWKLGAGKTNALTTVTRLCSSCSALLRLESFTTETMFQQGGDLVGGDASKLRFDAATNWSARDAGFSLNENDRFKSVRPWVEILAALGLQYFFLPPADARHQADARHRYHLWSGMLTPQLALAAVKGLIPQCTEAFEPVVLPNGKMKDVFTSLRVVHERQETCPPYLMVI